MRDKNYRLTHERERHTRDRDERDERRHRHLLDNVRDREAQREARIAQREVMEA